LGFGFEGIKMVWKDLRMYECKLGVCGLSLTGPVPSYFGLEED